jgi:hypothetical protein
VPRSTNKRIAAALCTDTFSGHDKAFAKWTGMPISPAFTFKSGEITDLRIHHSHTTGKQK